MYDPPAYLWAITIAGPTAIAALTCIVLYGGAERAGLGRRRAALLAGAAAVLLGGWFTATALIAGHGWYHTLPWFPVAVAGFLGTLLALSRIPVVARALTAPGMVNRLELPHTPRVAGVVFLFYLALGHLPALFALPAGQVEQEDHPGDPERVRAHEAACHARGLQGARHHRDPAERQRRAQEPATANRQRRDSSTGMRPWHR